MRTPGYQSTRFFYEQGARYGFTGVRTNLYRCHGQGLLQVITLVKSTKLSYEIYFGVFSLYSRINWISSYPLRNILQYDLHTTLDIKQIPGCEELYIRDLQQDIPIVLETCIPFFDTLTTHLHLAEMYEKFDINMYSDIRINDSQKIVPYILTGQYSNAINCITAIEQQNWNAYAHNSRNISGYENAQKDKYIARKLLPYITLREALIKKEKDALHQYLHTNYASNVKQLYKLGIPLAASCCVQLGDLFSDTE